MSICTTHKIAGSIHCFNLPHPPPLQYAREIGCIYFRGIIRAHAIWIFSLFVVIVDDGIFAFDFD